MNITENTQYLVKERTHEVNNAAVHRASVREESRKFIPVPGSEEESREAGPVVSEWSRW